MVNHKKQTREFWDAIIEYTASKVEYEIQENGIYYSKAQSDKLREILDKARTNLAAKFFEVTMYEPIFTPATESNKWTESWRLE